MTDLTPHEAAALSWLYPDRTHRLLDRYIYVAGLLSLEHRGLAERKHPDPKTNAEWRLTESGAELVKQC